jgi:ribosomal protein S28E/S33
VISDEGLSLLLGELVESVESTGEVSSVGLKGLADSLDNLNSLFVGDTGSEGEVSQVTADTDTGGDDHSCLISGQGRAVELGGVHVGDVLGILTVLVVLLNDLVEEGGEGGVRIVGSSVGTNTGVDVLATGEDAGLE